MSEEWWVVITVKSSILRSYVIITLHFSLITLPLFTHNSSLKILSNPPSCLKRKSATLMIALFCVGIPGLEPGKAGPESAVWPLHHIPMFVCFWFIALLRVQRYGLFPKPPNFFPTFFKKQRNISSFITKWLQNLLVSDFCCNFAAVFYNNNLFIN